MRISGSILVKGHRLYPLTKIIAIEKEDDDQFIVKTEFQADLLNK